MYPSVYIWMYTLSQQKTAVPFTSVCDYIHSDIWLLSHTSATDCKTSWYMTVWYIWIYLYLYDYTVCLNIKPSQTFSLFLVREKVTSSQACMYTYIITPEQYSPKTYHATIWPEVIVQNSPMISCILQLTYSSRKHICLYSLLMISCILSLILAFSSRKHIFT